MFLQTSCKLNDPVYIFSANSNFFDIWNMRELGYGHLVYASQGK